MLHLHTADLIPIICDTAAALATDALFNSCGLARALELSSAKDDLDRSATALLPNSAEAREQLHGRILQILNSTSAPVSERRFSSTQYAAVKSQIENLFCTDGTLCLSRAFAGFGRMTSQQARPGGEAASKQRKGRHRVHLELGCGDGEYALACAHRARELGQEDIVWVGVELRLDRALEAWMSVIKKKLPNVLVVCCDAGALLRRYLRSDSVHFMTIRFPQPPPSLVAARRSGDTGYTPETRSGGASRRETPHHCISRDRDTEARGVGGGGHLISGESFREMCRVLRPKACLRSACRPKLPHERDL